MNTYLWVAIGIWVIYLIIDWNLSNFKLRTFDDFVIVVACFVLGPVVIIPYWVHHGYKALKHRKERGRRAGHNFNF